MYRPLIIDDEKPVHRVINALGHWFSLDLEEPKSAYDGLAGLAAMRELRPDIVFLDMKMPLMNGIEFLKTASPEFPKTKFIVVSGYDEFTYTKIAIQYHVLDYLLKPIVEEELNAALKKARDLLDEENHIIRTDKPAPPTVSTEFLADAVKEYLDKNYARDIHLSELAELFHFSKEYISKLFKEKYGIGIYEYVLKYRMARAKELLLKENLQIQTISERLGYKDSNYFSKAFRTYYGLSPSEMKEKMQQKE
ncbi:MAG: helix-turn-helix domain-containing protein [Ruminococcaceae bacterium]|nr:helix-turn-helix domain-containing protein [Oscillospiraceae bacterium]HHV31505.1 helix-turn-helix domain-containing protein [Clostridiales bacterium]